MQYLRVYPLRCQFLPFESVTEITCNSYHNYRRNNIIYYCYNSSIFVGVAVCEVAPDKAQINKRFRGMIKESDGVAQIFKLSNESETDHDIFDKDYLANTDKKIAYYQNQITPTAIGKSRWRDSESQLV